MPYGCGCLLRVVLIERLPQVRGQRGVRLLDKLLIDSGGETVLERRFLTLIREAGLPRPLTQRRIRSNGRHVARVDFLYEEQRVVIEVSGRLGHSNPDDRDRDAQRRNELQDLGYRVYEYTWGHLTRRPDFVISSLEAGSRPDGLQALGQPVVGLVPAQLVGEASGGGLLVDDHQLGAQDVGEIDHRLGVDRRRQGGVVRAAGAQP